MVNYYSTEALGSVVGWSPVCSRLFFNAKALKQLNYNNHFSAIPAVTITAIAANDTSNRVAQITTLAQGRVEFTIENHNGDSITNAGACLMIIGKR